jgi:hypothetical protein
MLLIEQASELLKRCETILGTELFQIRGNLRKAESRASSVWELLVLEAAAELGKIEYEPHPGGSPDIRLFLPGYRAIWIEVAFLYPRFWKEERKSNVVTNWIYSEAERRGIPSYKIHPRFYGEQKNNAGPVRKLPELNARKQFLNSSEIKGFFNTINKKPSMHHCIDFTDYTLSVIYLPNAKGPYRTSSGLVQEAPNVVEEHAVYRVLKEKAKQHDINGPRVICLGSDQSRALSRTNAPRVVRLQDAINKIFFKNRSLSATIIVSIENAPVIFGRIKKQAKFKMFTNPYSKLPLVMEEIQLLSKLNFNKWKYASPLANWKNEGGDHFPNATGTLRWGIGPLNIKVEIPVNIIVDALAGKTTLAKAFDLKEEDQLYKAFNEGWVVEACAYKNGNIELGEAPKVVLQLSPPFRVYERNKKDA